MKCPVCQFDDEQPQARETWEPEVHFVEIEVLTLFKHDDRGLLSVSIYACPKCGALRAGREVTSG